MRCTGGRVGCARQVAGAGGADRHHLAVDLQRVEETRDVSLMFHLQHLEAACLKAGLEVGGVRSYFRRDTLHHLPERAHLEASWSPWASHPSLRLSRRRAGRRKTPSAFLGGVRYVHEVRSLLGRADPMCLKGTNRARACLFRTNVSMLSARCVKYPPRPVLGPSTRVRTNFLHIRLCARTV